MKPSKVPGCQDPLVFESLRVLQGVCGGLSHTMSTELHGARGQEGEISVSLELGTDFRALNDRVCVCGESWPSLARGRKFS